MNDFKTITVKKVYMPERKVKARDIQRTTELLILCAGLLGFTYLDYVRRVK